MRSGRRPRCSVFVHISILRLTGCAWVQREYRTPLDTSRLALLIVFRLAETTGALRPAGRIICPMNLVVAITGASGALYAQRFIQGLVAAGVQVHLVVSPLGRRLLHDELGMEAVDLPALAGRRTTGIVLYNYRDVGASWASARSSTTAWSSSLLQQHPRPGGPRPGRQPHRRAAAVALKEAPAPVLCHREMPLSAIDINKLQDLTEAGAICRTGQPQLLSQPATVAMWSISWRKTPGLVGVAHALDTRWDPATSAAAQAGMTACTKHRNPSPPPTRLRQFAPRPAGGATSSCSHCLREPWAVLATFLARRGWPKAGQLLLILLCMVSPTLAMSANRLRTARLDRAQPRTAGRAIPTGRLSRAFLHRRHCCLRSRLHGLHGGVRRGLRQSLALAPWRRPYWRFSRHIR